MLPEGLTAITYDLFSSLVAATRTRWLVLTVPVLLFGAACGSQTNELRPPESLDSASEQTTTIVSPTTADTSSTTIARTGPVRIMPLGDSITEGDDPNKPTENPQSYRGPLFAALVDAGYDVDFVGSQSRPSFEGDDDDHEGHGGYTIGPDNSFLFEGGEDANLAAHLDGWLDAAEPEVVLLMIGVNDQLPGEQEGGYSRLVEPADAPDKLVALVDRIRERAPEAIVLISSYPPISFLVDPSLDHVANFTALNTTARTLGSGTDPQVIYVPMFETLEDDWTEADTLATGDQLHPSAQGARRMADVWFDTLTPVLDGLG